MRNGPNHLSVPLPEWYTQVHWGLNSSEYLNWVLWFSGNTFFRETHSSSKITICSPKITLFTLPRKSQFVPRKSRFFPRNSHFVPRKSQLIIMTKNFFSRKIWSLEIFLSFIIELIFFHKIFRLLSLNMSFIYKW